jgi:hypothetical protein
MALLAVAGLVARFTPAAELHEVFCWCLAPWHDATSLGRGLPGAACWLDIYSRPADLFPAHGKRGASRCQGLTAAFLMSALMEDSG